MAAPKKPAANKKPAAKRKPTTTKKKTPAKKPRRRRKKPAPQIPPELWERQEGESAEAFQAFAAYRDMGVDNRSNAKVARQLGKSKTLMDRWSRNHRWQMRVGAWDLELDRVKQQELKDQQLEAAKRHAEISAKHLQAGDLLTASILKEVEADPKKLDGLPFDERVRLALQFSRAAPRLVVSERLSLGISTENLGGSDGGPLLTPDEKARRMGDDELEAFLLGAQSAAALRDDGDGGD